MNCGPVPGIVDILFVVDVNIGMFLKLVQEKLSFTIYLEIVGECENELRSMSYFIFATGMRFFALDITLSTESVCNDRGVRIPTTNARSEFKTFCNIRIVFQPATGSLFIAAIAVNISIRVF